MRASGDVRIQFIYIAGCGRNRITLAETNVAHITDNCTTLKEAVQLYIVIQAELKKKKEFYPVYLPIANVARSIIQTGLVMNMTTEMFKSPMEVAVYQLHNFSISFFSSFVGGDVVSVKLDNR